MNVDIVLITYNQEKYISEAVDSILMQEVGNDIKLKLIIADDCSTDNTVDIILDKIKILSYPYKILDTTNNLGISKNYKRAFDECDGDYIVILEGDDYWTSPYHIENHVRFLNRHRCCSLSMNRLIVKYESNSEFTFYPWNAQEEYVFIDTKTQIMYGNQLGNLSACVLCTSCVKKIPSSLYELSIADWMLGIMLSQYGLLVLLKEPTSVYRINSRSTWSSLSKEEQHKKLIKSSIDYDTFLNGKFHHYWEFYRKNLNSKPSFLSKIKRKLKSVMRIIL